MLVLADGIGGRPCDKACEAVADTFEEPPGALAEWLGASVGAAHRRVGKETGRCEEMLAALALARAQPF